MTHALGVYYAPEHHRPEDRGYIAKLQPPVIRLLDPDVQQIADMHALAPNAIIATRIWSIDDNGGEAVRDLMANPVDTGRRHADRYRMVLLDWLSQATARGLAFPPSNRIYFNAANEPNQGGTPDKIAAYNVAFLEQCTINQIRATALCLGVGWPDNSGPDTPVNWTPYAGIVDPIKRGQHWLELHEYNYKTGPQDGWTWLAGRHLQCPFDVPILLGEIGVDNYVDKARWDKEGGNRGWQGNMSPDQYGDMIQWHISHSDTRVVAALPFLLDFRNREWQSFDHNPANAAFLARKESMRPQATPAPTDTHTVYIPAAGSGTTMYVQAKDGANIRAVPTLDGTRLGGVPLGDAVTVLGDLSSQWVRVQYQGIDGYIYRSLLSGDKPQPAPDDGPAPTPQGDNWARSIAWVLRWEGGFQNNPADHGNYRPDGTLVGTNFGISARSYPTLDIPNITRQQAIDIYRRDYWTPSGASALAWPLCLLVMDTAVLHGVGAATQWLKEVGPNPYAFAAKRLRVYTHSDNWQAFAAGWINRAAELLEEMGK